MKPLQNLASMVVFTFTIILTACSGDSGSGAEGPSASGKDYKAILTALGVDEVTNPPDLVTTSTSGEKVTISDPDSWNPLKNEYVVFSPKSEVLQLGLTDEKDSDGKYFYNSVFEDAGQSYASSHPLSGDQTWESTSYKRTCAADLDGDGIQEFVVIYTPDNAQETLSLSVYANGSFSTPVFLTDISSAYMGTQLAKGSLGCGRVTFFLQAYLNSADVDGDGIEEILFASGGTACVLAIESDGSGVSVLDEKNFGESSLISSFTGGDCDGDGNDELLVTLAENDSTSDEARWALYDSSFDTELTSPEFITVSGSYLTQGCFGDFDGDNIDEICISTSLYASLVSNIYKFKDKSITELNSITDTERRSMYSYVQPLPTAVDIDGDGKDELYLGNGYVYDDVVLNSVYRAFDLYGVILNNYNDFISTARVGDVDGDAKEDLVLTHFFDQADDVEVVGFGVNSAGNGLVMKKRYAAYTNTDNNPGDANGGAFAKGYSHYAYYCCAVAVGNVDKDSSRVKYVGHELQFSNPIIIAALASPPYYADIMKDEETYDPYGWETTFGTSTSEETSDTGSVGISTGVSLEYEQDLSVFGVKIASFKSSASFCATTSCDFTTSMSVSKNISYSCTGGENRIIFTALPIDVYSYEVLESVDSSDTVGGILTIDIPRSYNTYTVDSDFYNENNGDLPDIGEEVFPHSLGAPETYPSAATMATLLENNGGYCSDKAKSVGQYDPEKQTSGGVTSLGISVEEGNGTQVGVDMATEFAVGAGVGGTTVMISAGFNVGYSYSISTTKGTEFGGTIGNLPTDYFNNQDYAYSQGLFAYPYPDNETGQTFWVVNYWLE